jgi:hypothetical protein
MSADPKLAPLIARERETVLQDVFGGLGPTMVEYSRYRNSLYHDILRLGGDTRAFEFCLKAYRFCIRKAKNVV